MDRTSLDALATVAKSPTIRWAAGLAFTALVSGGTWILGWNASLARVGELSKLEQRQNVQAQVIGTVGARTADLEKTTEEISDRLDAQIKSAEIEQQDVWRQFVLTHPRCVARADACQNAYDRLIGKKEKPAIAADRVLGLSAPPKAQRR